MLPSTLYIIWPFQLHSLKLLPLTVEEEIYLQEPWQTDFGMKLIHLFLKKKASIITQ